MPWPSSRSGVTHALEFGRSHPWRTKARPWAGRAARGRSMAGRSAWPGRQCGPRADKVPLLISAFRPRIPAFCVPLCLRHQPACGVAPRARPAAADGAHPHPRHRVAGQPAQRHAGACRHRRVLPTGGRDRVTGDELASPTPCGLETRLAGGPPARLWRSGLETPRNRAATELWRLHSRGG